MKNKKVLYNILLIIGLIMVFAGIFVLTGEEVKVVSGVSIGIGAGAFGMSLGELIKFRMIDNNSEFKRKVDIEAKDERNVYINSIAKAKTFDIMGIILVILMFVYLLMNEELVTIMLILGAYLIRFVLYIMFLNKYSKEN